MSKKCFEVEEKQSNEFCEKLSSLAKKAMKRHHGLQKEACKYIHLQFMMLFIDWCERFISKALRIVISC